MYGLSDRELRFAVVISSAHFSQHVYYRILPPLIPVLAVALAYPLWQLGLLISLYAIGMGIVQAPVGVLSDRMDRRYLLPTGIVLTGAAYVLFAAAPVLGGPLPSVTLAGYVFEGGFLVMSLAMLAVGVGLAVVHPVGYPMVTDNVHSSNKGKVLGVFGASSKIGDATAPAIVAVAILLLAWQQIVVLFGVVGVVYGVVLFVVLRSDEFETVPAGQRSADEASDDGPRGGSRDGAGSDDEENDGEASTGGVGTTDATADGTDVDGSASTDANEDAADGTAADGTAPTETGDGDRRGFLYPMVAVYLFFITSMLSTRGLNTFLPAFIVAVYAYSVEIGGVHVGAESVASVYFSVLLLAGAAMQLVLGGVTDARDPRLVLIGCMAIATAGMVVLAIVPLHPALLVVILVVLGTGLYGVNPARDALISDLSPPEHEGRTFGYVFTAVTLTGAPLPTAIGYLLDVVGMREGFLLLAAGPLLAGVCIGLLYSDRVYAAAGGPTNTEPAD
ncbi:MFS transporter [Halorubrum sp. DTA98]|uniref:MFS transporter n=1 Tax=Halorubrum sp. DTA98 TaxID=3402163 RepID=UPI003AB08AD6